MKIKYIIKEMEYILSYSDSKIGTKKTIGNFIQYLNKLTVGEQLLSNNVIELLNLIDLSKITSEEGFFNEFLKTEGLTEETNRTIIFYLIKNQQTSCWHSLDTTETWRWIAGCNLIISILSKDKINEVVLNEENPCFKIQKGTLFGARNDLTMVKDSDSFGLVTCECIPGFIPSLYSNPTKEQLEILSCLYKKNDDKKVTIEKLIPKVQLGEFNKLKSSVPSNFFLTDSLVKNKSDRNFTAKSSLSN